MSIIKISSMNDLLAVSNNSGEIHVFNMINYARLELIHFGYP